MKSFHADLKWQRTSPIAAVFFLFHAARGLVSNGLPAVAVIVAAYASGGTGRKTIILSGLLILLVISVISSVLQWMRFRFCIIDDRILLRSGVLHQEELSVAFDRMQNISIREPFYMRPFGLAVLAIDTAGSGQKEIILGGIPKDLAMHLRETILSVVETGTADNDEELKTRSDPGQLLSRSGKDIVIYGLTANFVLWIAIAVGAFFGAPDVAENALGWLESRIEVQDVIQTAKNSFGILGSLLMLIGFAIGVLLLLPLVSVMGALIRHYGYRLSVEGETYRRNGGLFTRHDESLKRHKIQAIVLKQNLVARFFKRTNMQLRVASAGSGVDSGQLPAASKSTFLVPSLHPFEVDELSKEFLPDCDITNTRFSRINRRRFSLLILGLMIIPVFAVTGSLSWLVSWKFVAIIPIVFAIAWLAISRYWKVLGYAVAGDYGFVRRGFVGSEITVFPLFKIQRIDVRQTPGQRRKGLAHISIHLASHSLNIPYVRIQDVNKFRDIALYYVESSRQAWY